MLTTSEFLIIEGNVLRVAFENVPKFYHNATSFIILS